MKLSAKITLSVVLIVALTVSISGYAIVSSVFRSQLMHQITAAADETQLLCSVLGTMAVERRSSTSAAVGFTNRFRFGFCSASASVASAAGGSISVPPTCAFFAFTAAANISASTTSTSRGLASVTLWPQLSSSSSSM